MEGEHESAEAQAAAAERALESMARGDAQLAEADRYLSSLRLSPSVWPILRALIRSTCSPLALSFAARTLHVRLRSDWPGLDDAARSAAFALALDGVRCCASTAAPAPPAHFFGRAVGFAFAQAEPNAREHMWGALQGVLTEPAQGCLVLTSLVSEINDVSTSNVEKRTETRAFCTDKAPHVIAGAVKLVSLPPAASTTAPTSSSDPARLRAAIACLRAWSMYGDKRQVVLSLMPVFVLAQHTDLITEVLTEIVGYSGTHPEMLLTVCDGLNTAFRRCEGEFAGTVHHAVAEVVCALSEGNADELMEQTTEGSGIVVSAVTELLWLCLEASDERAFRAALQGWGSWVAAMNWVIHDQRKVGREQIAKLVRFIVRRMTHLPFIETTTRSCTQTDMDDVVEIGEERQLIADLLLEAAKSIGIGEFSLAVAPYFGSQSESSANGICAALMALSVASSAADAIENEGREREIVLGILERVMTLLESHSAQHEGQEGAESTAIRRAALRSLSCYAHSMLMYGSDEAVYRLVRCGATAIYDGKVNEQAARLLFTLTGANEERLEKFLPELLATVKKAMPKLQIGAAEHCLRALARIVSSLESHEERMKAMERLLAETCERIKWTVGGQGGHIKDDTDAKVCQDLRLIAAAVREIEDKEVARRLFEQLKGDVFQFGMRKCSEADISVAICRLVEVCVIPTLLDYGDEDRRRNEDGRLELAMACAELAGECFRQSGPHGEACWLRTLGELTSQITWEEGWGVTNPSESVARSIGRALDGLQKFCADGYDARVDLTLPFLRLVKDAVHRSSEALLAHAESVGRLASCALQCSDVAVVREGVLFWRRGLICKYPGLSDKLVAGAGGAGGLAGALVCGAHVRRCASGVADVLFTLSRLVGDEGDSRVVRGLLEEAFRRDGVPCAGLDLRVRELLFRGCYDAAGSRRELRRALYEVARVSATVVMR